MSPETKWLLLQVPTLGTLLHPKLTRLLRTRRARRIPRRTARDRELVRLTGLPISDQAQHRTHQTACFAAYSRATSAGILRPTPASLNGFRELMTVTVMATTDTCKVRSSKAERSGGVMSSLLLADLLDRLSGAVSWRLAPLLSGEPKKLGDTGVSWMLRQFRSPSGQTTVADSQWGTRGCEDQREPTAPSQRSASCSPRRIGDGFTGGTGLAVGPQPWFHCNHGCI
jgi:hypothetical protein